MNDNIETKPAAHTISAHEFGAFQQPTSKVRLYTRQDIRSLQEIEASGFFTNKIVYVRESFGEISGYILNCYRYFVEQAAKRIKKPDNVELPVWCSISNKNCLQPIANTIVYVLEVPTEEVIYFDGTKWDYVLNHHYIPLNDEDLAMYEKGLTERGFDNGFEFFEGKYRGKFPQEMRTIMKSWVRIFDIDEWDIFKVQANIWQIKKEWIVSLVRPGEPIP